MTTTSLKLAYAVITIGVASRMYVLGENGGDPTWLAGAYFVATIAFAALVVVLTMKAVDPKASRDDRIFGTIASLLSFWATMPTIFFLWGAFWGNLIFALQAFSLSAGVSASFYLSIRALRLILPSGRGVQ